MRLVFLMCFESCVQIQIRQSNRHRCMVLILYCNFIQINYSCEFLIKADVGSCQN